MSKRLLLQSLLVPVLVIPAMAQKYSYPYGDEDKIRSLASQPPASRTEEAIRDALNIGNGTNITKLVLYAGGYKKFLEAVENARMDKQQGSDSSSQGTTSLVAKGVAAQVLSLATEQGALTRTDSKTTSTLRLNTLGTARLLAGADQFPYCAIYDYRCEAPLARFLRAFSTGVSFYTTPSQDKAGGAGNTNLLNESNPQVAGWNVRYDFHVRRKPEDLAKDYESQFRRTYAKAVADGNAVLDAIGGILTKLRTSDAYVEWQQRYVSRLRSSEAETSAGLQKVLGEAVTDLAQVAKQADPAFQSDADAVLEKMGTYFGNRDRLLADYVNRLTFSMEYDNDRPLHEPTQSTAKFIVSLRPRQFNSKALLTANYSVQWYDHTLHSGINRVRDMQAALQFDRALGVSGAPVSPTISIGYYFQYMVSNALLNLPSSQFAPGTTIPLPGDASELLNTKGSIHLGQAKVTFAIRNTGINFPLALTFSNRTDLLKASEVRGNFGITYDLDSLFTRH